MYIYTYIYIYMYTYIRAHQHAVRFLESQLAPALPMIDKTSVESSARSCITSTRNAGAS